MHAKPQLTLRVGVTGHRSNKLTGNRLYLIDNRVRDILIVLRNIAHDIQKRESANGSGSFYCQGSDPELRLVTSLAEGSDTLVSEAAVAQGFVLNLVLPYPQARYEEDFSGDSREKFQAMTSHTAVRNVFALDVAETLHEPAAYAAAGEMMLQHCDVLIAIWDGASAAGVGGTAEVVHQAQKQGHMVVWVDLDGAVQLWTAPANPVDAVADGQWVRLDQEKIEESGALDWQVRAVLEPPTGETARKCLRDFLEEPPRDWSFACGYKLLLSLLVGGSLSPRVNYGVSENRSEGWRDTLKAAKELGGSSFADLLSEKLKERWLNADSMALHYAHCYRSTYVTNFLLAALAVLVGLLAVPLWDSLAGKSVLVVAELTLILTIILRTRRGHRKRWHERWLDYRNIAESLRPARLPALMGSSPSRPGNIVGSTPGRDWVAWYVRAVLREIDPPTGVIGAKALQRVLDVSVNEELDKQIQYHQFNTTNLIKLDHRFALFGELFLWVTMAAGAAFLGTYAVGLSLDNNAPAKIIKPWTTFLGGVLPVFGAAMFAIRATGDFRSASHQSGRMVNQLVELRQQLENERAAPTRARTRHLLAETTRTMAEDLRVWGLIYSERPLTPGF